MPISRQLLKEIEMNPTRTGSASRWSCTGSTIQAAMIEPSKEIETLQADKRRSNGCSEGVGTTEVDRDDLRRVYTVESTRSCG
jgi:hypothetical protein